MEDTYHYAQHDEEGSLRLVLRESILSHPQFLYFFFFLFFIGCALKWKRMTPMCPIPSDNCSCEKKYISVQIDFYVDRNDPNMVEDKEFNARDETNKMTVIEKIRCTRKTQPN